MKKLLSLLVMVLLLQVAYGQKPRIIILATGGTIAGEGASADRAGYTAGKIPVSELIGSIPTISQIADVSGEQISSVGSQDMSLEIWKKLALRINEIFSKKEADGIVITHGTDTQEETAYFLDLVISSDNPVVLTGSMRASTAISADGPKNLFDAITVAASPKSRNRGVLVSFNESIFSSRDVTKLSTTKVNAFGAPNSGPVGQVFDGKVEYYKTSERRTPHVAPFTITKNTVFPKVEIFYMYTDPSPSYFDCLLKDKVAGIVIAGVGNGNFSKPITAAVKKAIADGIAVCRGSRCISGRVVEDGEVNDKELGTIVSDDLNPQKARILLMLGLTKTHKAAELQKYFLQY
ncbi:type II asparaginase [Pedobacter gandavensis]|uniref:type II asparaginase n=1 Tax=Pedobacter gandavensis TaxID=2679963 RepID=UPI00292FD2C9|nr:type II asparaginase [Pedobacter gandavensis]